MVFFGELHEPERLAVAFRARHAEIAPHVVVDVLPLAVTDQHHLHAVERREPADEGGVVAEVAVAVQLEEVGEDEGDVVGEDRSLGMPRDLDGLHRRQVLVDLLHALAALGLEPGDLGGHRVALLRGVLLELVDLLDHGVALLRRMFPELADLPHHGVALFRRLLFELADHALELLQGLFEIEVEGDHAETSAALPRGCA